jgi:hypothetical protein
LGKVPIRSAIRLPQALETMERIDGKHMQMARCSSRDNPGYGAITGVLKAYVRRELRGQQMPPTVVGAVTTAKVNAACT